MEELFNNYEDLSTDTGFQFQYVCSKCGKTFQTDFEAYTVGKISGLLNTASDIFGGILNTAANASENIRSAGWQKAHDNALKKSVAMAKDKLIQCSKCTSWVCHECFNEEKQLCKSCAPDLGVEMSAAQASKSVEEVWAHAAMASKDKKLGLDNWRNTIKAKCPNCKKDLAGNVKFCPDCGAKINTDTKCPKCGSEISGSDKFCGECGYKIQ